MAYFHDKFAMGTDSVCDFHRYLKNLDIRITVVSFRSMVDPASIWFGDTHQHAVVDNYGNLMPVRAFQ